MAFKLRVGAPNMPQEGDTISVYYTGTTVTVSPIFTPDSIGATLSNPFTIPASGYYGFEPLTSDRVDVYWHEEGRTIIEDVNVKDVYLDADLLEQYILHGEEQEYINLATVSSSVEKDGVLYWNESKKTVSLKSGTNTIEYGQDSVILVYNNTGSTISKHKAVSCAGAYDGKPSVALTNSKDENLALNFIGVTLVDIPHGQQGLVIKSGEIESINTSSLSLGSVYVDENVVGGFTNTEPSSLSYRCNVGRVLSVSATGKLLVCTDTVPTIVGLSMTPTLSSGVMVSDGANIFFTEPGEDGQILMSQGTVSNPIWSDRTEYLFNKKVQIEVATAGQTTFILDYPVRMDGSNFAVYIDGRRQYDDAYSFADTGTLVFSEGVTEGSKLLFLTDELETVPRQPVFEQARELQTATEGQTTFTLTNSYNIGCNNILVYIDGRLQYNNSSYVEVDANTIEFSEGLSVGQQVLFVINDIGAGSYYNSKLLTSTSSSGGTNSATHGITDIDDKIINVSGVFKTSTDIIKPLEFVQLGPTFAEFSGADSLAPCRIFIHYSQNSIAW